MHVQLRLYITKDKSQQDDDHSGWTRHTAPSSILVHTAMRIHLPFEWHLAADPVFGRVTRILFSARIPWIGGQPHVSHVHPARVKEKIPKRQERVNFLK